MGSAGFGRETSSVAAEQEFVIPRNFDDFDFVWSSSGFARNHETDLDTVSTGSGSDLVILGDQVATAPCTDRIQLKT
jgi:hypothetical protein